MRRITPRTCLWPVTISILLTFALSIGLTFRSDHHCYAGVCGEWLFPLQARLHVVIWYSWISISITCLVIRAFSKTVLQVLRKRVVARPVPFIKKSISLSGLLALSWVLSLYGVVVGVWWLRLRDYFDDRGNVNSVTRGNNRLAAIALTGHFCDITMGMVLLPISRHSALESFFKISVATARTFHMLAAYSLFVLVLIHGLLYVSWLPVWTALSAESRKTYPLLNPTYLYDQVWPGNTSSLGIWRASLVFTGFFVSLIMCLIFVTTLPQIRGRHFNVFYFTHLLVILIVIVICLHASTMFYCCAPGLVLWVVDWGMRVFELRQPVESTIQSLGKNFYVLTMKMPRHRLSGCACHSPLAHFYIYHSESSLRELHPFTTITHLASEKHRTPKDDDDVTIQFLFKKRLRSEVLITEADVKGKRSVFESIYTLVTPKKRQRTQWTERLASKAHAKDDALHLSAKNGLQQDSTFQETPENGSPRMRVDIALRLEGPYFTPAMPATYRTVICLTAGTGISGGIAIARAFFEAERQRATSVHCETTPESCTTQPVDKVWQRCIVVWCVRETDHIDLPFFEDQKSSSFEMRTHMTGNGRPRFDFLATLRGVLETPASNPVWAYISGPNSFIIEGEKACDALGIDHFGAKWEI